MSARPAVSRAQIGSAVRLIAITGLVVLALIAVSATPTAAATVTPTLLVANTGGTTLTSYPLSATGDPSPAATVSSNGSGSLAQPSEVVLDASGNLWVANSGNNTVVEYAKSQLPVSGAPAPAVTLSSDGANSLAIPSGVAFDAAGNLWVANFGGDTVVEYTKSQLAASGSPAPAVTLSSDGSNSLDGPYSVAFDAAGDLWVPNELGNTVVKYTPSQLAATGSPAPAITLSSDSTGSLTGVDGVVFDAAGDLWASDSGSGGDTVVKYTPGQLTASATPTPAVTLTSDASGSLAEPGQAAFDGVGDLWVSNYQGGTGGGSVVEFTPGQLVTSGSPSPVDTITGAATGLVNPHGLAIEQAPTVASISPASGPGAGGTEVTISGTGFYPGDVVDFGATPAGSATYVSPYGLRAVSPAGSGTVDVSVTTGQGASATSSADRFTYTTTTPSTTPPGTTPPGTTPPGRLRPQLRSGGHVLKVVRGVAGLPVACSVASCHGTLRITERVVVRVRRGRKTVRREKTIVLATARYTIRAGRHATLRVRLDGAARRALAKARHHRLSALAMVTVTGGAMLKERVTLVEQVHHEQAKGHE